MSKMLTIATAVLGGLKPSDPGQVSLQVDIKARAQDDAKYLVTLPAPLNVGIHNMYAGHRSHSSHSSHRSHSSHSSHYSGSGGSYTPYVPAQAPNPAPSVAPLRESSSYPHAGAVPTQDFASPSPTSTRASQDQLKLMIMRVQAALFAQGYDPGAIDGVLSAQTKIALEIFQSRHGLKVTGTMSTETLNALGVALSP